LEAGFTEEELEDLRKISSEGPSRATMREAAKRLRERHQARKAAQSEQVSA
jgi:hypothetical protein